MAEYKPGRWLNDRLTSARVPRAEKHRLCGKRRITVKCNCRVLHLPVDCGDRWLCPACVAREAKRSRRKLRAAMLEVRARRGFKWRMITLTLDHGGAVAERVQTLKESWARLRVWMHSRLGKFDYAAVMEFTPGRDGCGHPHLHIAAFLPFLDYADLHRAWLRASRGRSNHVDVQTMRSGAKGAASYLAKYVSKRSDMASLPPYLAAEALAALWQRRAVTVSRGFWIPKAPCDCCHTFYELVELPRSLADYSMIVASTRALGGRAPPGQARWC